MNSKQNSAVAEKSMEERFCDVIAEISAYSYPSSIRAPNTDRHEDLNDYLNSEEFGVFWHGCLGNILSNWYFFCRDEEPQLQRIHKQPGCSLNPSWADNLKLVNPSGPVHYSYDPMAEKDRKDRQDWIDNSLTTDSRDEFSIVVVHSLFSTGDIWWSETEKRAGWIFMKFGELLLYSFEFHFLKSIRQFPSFSQLLDSDPSNLFKYADEAWDQVLKAHGHPDDSKELEEKASKWLKEVITNSSEYESWRHKQEKDWFVLRGDSLEFGSGPRDWAIGICNNSRHTQPKESLLYFKKRCRFSPTAEATHKTRNMVIFPLWVDESFSKYQKIRKRVSKKSHSGRRPTLRSPFTAYFVATFCEASIWEKYGRLIRSLLSTMAYPDIFRFVGEAVALRQDVENVRYYGAGLNHDLMPRVGEISSCLNRIKDNVPPQSVIAHDVKKAQSNLFLIRKISSDFRDYSQQSELSENLRLAKTSLRKLVTKASEFTGTLCLKNSVDAQLLVDVDADRMLRVLINVLKNARESMWNRDPQDMCVQITASSHGNVVYMDISDDGVVGIPREKWTTVFEPEFSTKDRTRGLGLTLSRLIIDAHKDRLGVGSIFIKESSVDCGTTVRIELPKA